MKKTTLTLAEHVDHTLAPYRRSIPMALAVVVSFLLGGTIFGLQLRSDTQILAAINAHVASLIETQDRPELQRLLKSVGDARGSLIEVSEGGLTFASNGPLSDLDRPVMPRRGIALTPSVSVSWKGLRTERPVRRANGPEGQTAVLSLTTPLSESLFAAIFGAFLTLLGSLACSRLLRGKLKVTIEAALKPIEDLDAAIRELHKLSDSSVLRPSPISELDNIRVAILDAHKSIREARDALAEKKAKALLAEAYRRLIHDLHNPVAALRTSIKISEMPNLSVKEQEQTTQKITRIAGQILNQVTAAKFNLDFEAESLIEEDVRSCILEATETARLASLRYDEIRIQSEIPESPVVLSFDNTLLGRAIINLVSNATAACKEQVQVVVKKVADLVTIQVMDDGPGLSQEAAGLFLQGRARSTKEDRPAFGLAAANHIVRAHGGKIIYRTSDLGGACFEVRLSV